MVEPSLASLFVTVEGAEIVVKVGGAGAQHPAQESGVGREHCRHIDLPDPDGHKKIDLSSFLTGDIVQTQG